MCSFLSLLILFSLFFLLFSLKRVCDVPVNWRQSPETQIRVNKISSLSSRRHGGHQKGTGVWANACAKERDRCIPGTRGHSVPEREQKRLSRGGGDGWHLGSKLVGLGAGQEKRQCEMKVCNGLVYLGNCKQFKIAGAWATRAGSGEVRVDRGQNWINFDFVSQGDRSHLRVIRRENREL